MGRWELVRYDLVVIPRILREQLLPGINSHLAVFLSAGSGWGKTVSVTKLLEHREYSYFSLNKTLLRNCVSKKALVVLDDLEALSAAEERDLFDMLQSAPFGQHFVLLSRAPLPEPLTLLELSDSLLCLDERVLALDLEAIAGLAEGQKLDLEDEDLVYIEHSTEGNPVAVRLLFDALKAGLPLQRQTMDTVFLRVGAFLEETCLVDMNPEEMDLITKLSYFPEFDTDLADMLRGGSDAAPMLDRISRCTALIVRSGGAWQFRQQKYLMPYLQRRAKAILTETERKEILLAGGHWYSDHRDYHSALRCYRESDSRDDLMKALIHNARCHPGTGAYYEMRDYYLQLTEKEILSSPELICAMAMLCSMTFDGAGAERWTAALKTLYERMDRQDPDYARTRGLLAYLSIALPHRGSAKLSEMIPAVYELLKNRDVVLPEMSVTSNLPSLLRGGKDFSSWVPKDHSLYRTIRIPVEAVLGRFGVGLGDLALTESLLEKGEDVTDRIIRLSSLRMKIQREGVPEMEFVLVALMARTFYAAGQIDDAWKILTNFRTDMANAGVSRLLPNIDAFLCRLSLMQDSNYANVWFRDQAPARHPFLSMERYRYLTLVRCDMKRRLYPTALLLLGEMLTYTEAYDRTLDHIESLLLAAICRYRMGGGDWQDYLAKALERGAIYRYVAVFTREGTALLPLLQQFDHSKVQRDYWRRILDGTITMAGYYGQYLSGVPRLRQPLTETENLVLQLVCQNKSVEEICALLYIKTPTVKTHLQKIYKKLGAKNRAEAVMTTEKLGLFRPAPPQAT